MPLLTAPWGAAKMALWEVQATTPEVTPHCAAVLILPATFCLHISGAYLVSQEPDNALCEAERKKIRGYFEAEVCRRLVKGSAASSSMSAWLGVSPLPVLPSMPGALSPRSEQSNEDIHS